MTLPVKLALRAGKHALRIPIIGRTLSTAPITLLRLLPRGGRLLKHSPLVIRKLLVFPVALFSNALRGKRIAGISLDGNAISFLMVTVLTQVIAIDAPPFVKNAAWTNILQSTLVLGLWEAAAHIQSQSSKDQVGWKFETPNLIPFHFGMHRVNLRDMHWVHGSDSLSIGYPLKPDCFHILSNVLFYWRNSEFL
jgi:hypothetical protein